MKHFIRRMLPLLIALLLIVPMAFANHVSPIREIGLQLAEAQTNADAALIAANNADDVVARLEKQYANNENDAEVQDALIDAMILQEEAAEALAAADLELAAIQAAHAALVQTNDSCETLEMTYDGKYADLEIAVTLDENLVIYDLQVTVKGDERDQAVGLAAYLYSYIGHDLPLSIGTGKADDVRPADGAQKTSESLVETLNSLVYGGEEEEPQGPITDPQGIADYIFRYGKLPDNFITKKEAQNLGWDSSRNYVGDVAPGKSIGGDRFGNYEGLLPSKKGRTWYEADCYYQGKKRNAYRILYSSDGLVYYTDDHYETFTQMFPSWEK